MATSEEKAWEKFCGKSLRREGYENDGFKAVKVKLTLEEIQPWSNRVEIPIDLVFIFAD